MAIIAMEEFLSLYEKGERIEECFVSTPNILPTPGHPIMHSLVDSKTLVKMFDWAKNH